MHKFLSIFNFTDNTASNTTAAAESETTKTTTSSKMMLLFGKKNQNQQEKEKEDDPYAGFGVEEVAAPLQTDDLEYDEGFQVQTHTPS